MTKSKRNGRGINSKGRSVVGDRFVRLDHWMLASPAWAALTADGQAVLVAIQARYNARNNGRISFGVRDAQQALAFESQGKTRHPGAPRAMNALRDAQRKGFLRCRAIGEFDVKTGESSLASEWELTSLPVPGPGGTPARKDFMRWKLGKDFEVAEAKSKTRLTKRQPDG